MCPRVCVNYIAGNVDLKPNHFNYFSTQILNWLRFCVHYLFSFKLDRGCFWEQVYTIALNVSYLSIFLSYLLKLNMQTKLTLYIFTKIYIQNHLFCQNTERILCSFTYEIITRVYQPNFTYFFIGGYLQRNF